ncbi:hypothetical protein EDC04DRAFT_2602201 [Pisolithus marmoratus]|nr:hypothetical protein EDC04DRAFT_2602201 [Pisolithus marmoratus]
MIRDSSGPDETSAGVEDKMIPDCEQVLPTCKHKVESQQSSCPTKRVAIKKRLRTISPLLSDSSVDEQALSIQKLKAKPQKLSRPMEQLASSPERDTKAVQALSPMRPASKKNQLRFISPLSSEEELDTYLPRDQLQTMSSKMSVEHPQPSKEWCVEQFCLPESFHAMRWCNLRSKRVNEPVPMKINQLPATHPWDVRRLKVYLLKCLKMRNHAQECAQDTQVCSVPSEDVHNIQLHESQQEQPEVMVPLPAVGSMESGRSLRKTVNNSLPYPLAWPPHLQSGRPRLHLVWGAG